MNSFGRSMAIGALILVALSSAALATSPVEWGGCTAPNFKSDKPAIIVACTTILDRSDLSDADRAQALKFRGRALHQSGKLNAAIGDFDEALKLAPKDAELYMRRGWTAYDEHDYDHVVALAGEALKLDPNDAGAYDLLGAAGAMTNNLGMAKAAYDKAIELKPANVLARYHRYQLYRAVHAQREALQELEDLLRLQTSDLDTAYTRDEGKPLSYRTLARKERAGLLELMGRIAEAEKAYDEFVRVEPGPFSYGWRAGFRMLQNQHDLAQADLDKALSYDPNFGALLNLQGNIYFYTQQYDRSVQAFTRAVDIDHDGPSYWGRSMALRKLHRVEEATKDALKAVTDRNFLNRKAGKLAKLGYLQLKPNEEDVMPAVRDAVQACMLDDKCW
jgi:tetratricopeptide (TPR) repeat protein